MLVSSNRVRARIISRRRVLRYRCAPGGVTARMGVRDQIASGSSFYGDGDTDG